MDGTRIGPYELGPLLGVGGMGEVFRAHDTRRDRDVALKLLPESLAHDDEYVARFRRESHAAARLTEPHVIPIHDYGEIDGRLYIDMRLVEGPTARDLLADEGRLSPERTADLVGQVADALAAAHADGLVHRDIKPSNVLVAANDFAYVVDFGIARSIGTAQPSLTITGVTVGTLDYMAPERFLGAAIDGRSDVYSLACLAYEFLTGSRPFSGEDLPSLMYAHLYTDPPSARGTVPALSPQVDAVLARSMAKSADDRHPDARSFAADLRAALSAESEVATAPAPSGEAARSTVVRPVPTPAAAPATPGTGGPPAGGTPAGSTPAGGTPPPSGVTAARHPGPDTARTGPVVLPRRIAVPPPRAPWSSSTPPGAPPPSAPPPGPPGAGAPAVPTRRGRPRMLWLTVAAVLAVVLGAAGALTGLVVPASVEVRLEPVGTAGENPFLTRPAGVDRTGVTTPASTTGSVSGDTPGLYAVSPGAPSCDVQKIVDDLRADPVKATAWAAVQRIRVIDITTWLTGQNPVTLRADAAATEYRYSEGRSNAEPVVLQAGTAVLVDQYGTPVVKCMNGNPLTPPPAPEAGTPAYSGPAWPAFTQTRVTVVVKTVVPVTTIVVVNPSNGAPTPVPRPDPAPGPGCTRSGDGWTCVPVPDPENPPAEGCTVAGNMWSCPIVDPSAPPADGCTQVGGMWSCTPRPDPSTPPRAGCTLKGNAWTCPRSAAATAAAADAARIAAQPGMTAAMPPECLAVAAGAARPAYCPPATDPRYALRPDAPAGQAPVAPAPGGTSQRPGDASSEPGPASDEPSSPDPGTVKEPSAPDSSAPEAPASGTSAGPTSSGG